MNRHSDAWTMDALCKETDPEIFFPGSRGRWAATDALAICSQCPVRQPCLQEAIELGDDWSVRGGTTPAQRRKMIRSRRRHAASVELPVYTTVVP